MLKNSIAPSVLFNTNLTIGVVVDDGCQSVDEGIGIN